MTSIQASVFASIGMLLFATTAVAGPRYARDTAGSYVTAESRFGNGTISGPVRMTSLGPQVRLPGGTWEYCRRSCKETLRVQTVDFWENPTGGGSSAITNECGIFGCLELRYPR